MDWEQVWRWLDSLWKNHQGKTTGVVLGLIFGLLTVILGFWKALFIAICVAVGYWLGKRADEEGNIRKFLDRFTGER